MRRASALSSCNVHMRWWSSDLIQACLGAGSMRQVPVSCSTRTRFVEWFGLVHECRNVWCQKLWRIRWLGKNHRYLGMTCKGVCLQQARSTQWHSRGSRNHIPKLWKLSLHRITPEEDASSLRYSTLTCSRTCWDGRHYTRWSAILLRWLRYSLPHCGFH